MVISKKTIIFQGFRGGGVQHLPGVGVQMLYISKETNKICDFSGSSRGHYPTSGPANVSYCPKFWTGPQQLEKMPSDPVAAKCIIYILC